MVASKQIDWFKPLRRVKTGEAVYVVGVQDHTGRRKVSPVNQWGSGGLWYDPDGTPNNHPGGPVENYNPLAEVMSDTRDMESPSFKRLFDDVESEDFGSWS